MSPLSITLVLAVVGSPTPEHQQILINTLNAKLASEFPSHASDIFKATTSLFVHHQFPPQRFRKDKLFQKTTTSLDDLKLVDRAQVARIAGCVEGAALDIRKASLSAAWFNTIIPECALKSVVFANLVSKNVKSDNFTCNPGAFFDTNQVACVGCVANCSQLCPSSFPGPYCFSCQDGYFLQYDENELMVYCNKCHESCTAGCKQGIAFDENPCVETCGNGYYYSDSYGYCLPCDSDCAEPCPQYLNATFGQYYCHQCKPGHYLFLAGESTGYCLECDSGCVDCPTTSVTSYDYCTQCHQGYTLRESYSSGGGVAKQEQVVGTCIPCDPLCITECPKNVSYYDTNYCKECNGQSFLTYYGCEECDPNCETVCPQEKNVTMDSYCHSCASGHYLQLDYQSETGFCEKCMRGCATECPKNVSYFGQYCLSCEPGYREYTYSFGGEFGSQFVYCEKKRPRVAEFIFMLYSAVVGTMGLAFL